MAGVMVLVQTLSASWNMLRWQQSICVYFHMFTVFTCSVNCVEMPHVCWFCTFKCAHECVSVADSRLHYVPDCLALESWQTAWFPISAGHWLKVRLERTCWVDRLSATSSRQMVQARALGHPARSRVITGTHRHVTAVNDSNTELMVINMLCFFRC